LTFSSPVRRLLTLPAIALMCALYLSDLTGMGLVGPDEPRYADVGRFMARSGDWVTPHLWGQPWFEKPALLYWMTAAGFDAGLGPDLAPRLPVALLSTLFLLFYWKRLQAEWGVRAASYSTAMLATSAGWLTYSHVAVTDVPLAVFFSAALLLSLPWIERGERKLLPAAAACLGFATLAKGLVPLVLFVPVAAMPAFAHGWRRPGDWFRPAPLAAFSICALPWYILVTLRNGSEFLRVFFLEQHFSRFSSTALQHVQPVWFYVPVFLILLFPWFPLLAAPSIAFPREFRQDTRVRTLAAVVVFGFIFFTASVNKLFGYLLPLLPAVCALLGLGLAKSRRQAPAMIVPLMLLAALPVASSIAPRLLDVHGDRSIGAISGGLAIIIVLAATAGVAGTAVVRFAPRYAFGTVAAIAGMALLWFQFATFPRLDAAGSARAVWLGSAPQCTPAGPRDLLYGMYYYSGKKLPICAVLDPSGTRVVR
jgi:4-amino-4-deoxy-L-arabinose transferase-like glycosyltransferase